ncbi:MAG TPA: pyridoxal phosphate-dependent aminotransferase [Candidatus Eisenbacteria bacterium]|nr:pyridoxal phosphate-dependent aminotransferase [Candidatus Eisenbacteria bacterium]
MLSRRIPAAAPNRWAAELAARRAAGGRLLDLTEANPTRVGLAGEAGAFAAAAAAPAVYDPDPRGRFEARAAVAAIQPAPVDPDAVLLTTGTSESYAHLFRLLADPGARVLAPQPSYPLFEPLAALEGVTLEPWRLAWDGAWHVDRDSVERGLARGARAVIVVQPNHPTGSCLDPGEMAWLEGACAARDAAIVSDEVFHEFGWNGPLPGFAGRERALTFALGGLSKSCGLPNLKLGWIVASGPVEQRRRALGGLEWIADLFLSVASPVQHAVPGLLAARAGWQRRVRERIAHNLALLDGWIGSHPELTRLPAAGGWVAVLRLPRTRSDEAWALALLARGVVVHPGHFYDFAADGHVVVSLIVEPGVLEAGLAAWEGALRRS